MANEDLKTQHENVLDEMSHLKKDAELTNSERKQEEGSVHQLAKDNERLRLITTELRDVKVLPTSTQVTSLPDQHFISLINAI